MTTVTLSQPVAIGPQLFDSLTFKPIKLGEWPMLLRAMSLTDLDDILRLIAQLANVPLEVVCQIDGDDIAPVLDGLTAHVAKHAPKIN